MKTETIEEWAERVAPTLDAEGWRRLNLAASGVLWSDDERLVLADGTEVDHQQARALLAVRDRVVDGLTDNQRVSLLAVPVTGTTQKAFKRAFYGLTRSTKSRPALIGAGLVMITLTSLGRECARVLREGE